MTTTKRRRKPIALKVGKITADIDSRGDNSKRGDFLVGPRIVTNSTREPDSASSGPQVWLSEECQLVAVQMPIKGTNHAAHVAIDSNGQLWVDIRKIQWDGEWVFKIVEFDVKQELTLRKLG